MNDPVSGKLRWGPADRRRSPWFRSIPAPGLIWQNAGIGGTTLHYWGNSPRAYPQSIDGGWPIRYEELIPYYEKVEETLPIQFAPVAPKEALFFYGAEKAGFPLIPSLDITESGYRPQPNAILPPNPHLKDPRYSLEQLSHMEGCTLSGHCVQGCPYGPSLDKMAKRSTNVSYVPLAMKTGNVSFRPNSFAVKVLTETGPDGSVRAIGVSVRNTWTGEIEEHFARAVVMSAGAIETPRLWLNSGLPDNPWVGRGLTSNANETVTGYFDEKTLMKAIGRPTVDPFIGHTSGARLDYPGLGTVQNMGLSPGLTAMFNFGNSQAGYNVFLQSEEWDQYGRVTGSDLQQNMDEYRRSLSILILTDDEVRFHNRVTLDPFIQDEHGSVAPHFVSFTFICSTEENPVGEHRHGFVAKSGCVYKVHRNDLANDFMIHAKSTMRMGKVVDVTGEAFQVKRLFIADNSVHADSVGGVNPTLTTQALATRTAEKLANLYFS